MDRIDARSDFGALFWNNVAFDSGIQGANIRDCLRIKNFSEKSIFFYCLWLNSKKWSQDLTNRHVSVVSQIWQEGRTPQLMQEVDVIQREMLEGVVVSPLWENVFREFPNIEALLVAPDISDNDIATFSHKLKKIIFQAEGEVYVWGPDSLERFRRLENQCPHITQFRFSNCTFSKQSISDYFPQFTWIKIGDEKITPEQFMNLKEGLYELGVVNK